VNWDVQVTGTHDAQELRLGNGYAFVLAGWSYRGGSHMVSLTATNLHGTSQRFVLHTGEARELAAALQAFAEAADVRRLADEEMR
jgi:hypothetical protein